MNYRYQIFRADTFAVVGGSNDLDTANREWYRLQSMFIGIDLLVDDTRKWDTNSHINIK